MMGNDRRGRAGQGRAGRKMAIDWVTLLPSFTLLQFHWPFAIP